MTLEFQPYFQPDRNQDRESLANLNQTIGNIGNQWQQYGQQQRENKLQQAYLDLARQRQMQEQANAGPLISGNIQGFSGNPTAFTPGGTSSWSPSPLDIGRQPWAQSPSYGGGTPNGAPSPSSNLSQGTMGPQPQSPTPVQSPTQPYQQFVSAGTSDTGQTMPLQSMPFHAPGTDLSSHFQAWQQQGMPQTYNHPEMGGIGQTEQSNNPMDGINWDQFARMNKNQREGYIAFGDQQRKMREEQDRYGTGANGLYSTLDQAAFQMAPGDPSKQAALKAQMLQIYPNGRIPKSAITATTGGIRFDINQGEKTSQFGDKRLTALGDSLDPSKQRAGAFGVSKQVFDRAERLESLASAFKDGNLDSRQIEELAIGLNAMLSGSNTGAQEQVRSLIPNTIIGNGQKIKEWLLNQPQGLQQQQFVQRMLGSIAREKQTAADQIKRTQFQRISRYQDLEKSNPDGFYSTLQAQGIDPDEYHQWKSGGYKFISAVQNPESGQNNGMGGQQFSHTATGKNGQKIGWNGQQWVPIQ